MTARPPKPAYDPVFARCQGGWCGRLADLWVWDSWSEKWIAVCADHAEET
jgi:hypothetical protein